MSSMTFLLVHEYDAIDAAMDGGTGTHVEHVKEDMFDAHHYFSMLMLYRERMLQYHYRQYYTAI